MDSDCQQIAEAFRTMSRAAMAINEILGRRDDLNELAPVDWPLQLSAGEFASECLGMAAHYEGARQRRTMIYKTCPDCNAALGEKHEDGCDVERCPHCGGQALGCVGFNPNDPRLEPWTGKWPGEADCERFDRSLPDINRLLAECIWNAERQRWEQPTRWGMRDVH